MHRLIRFLIGVLWVLAIAPGRLMAQAPLCAHHQVGCSPETGNLPELGTPVGTFGTTRVYIADDRVRLVDLETLELREVPVDPFVQLWDSLTIPLRSMGIGGPGPSAWIWDASGGTPLRLPLRDGERAQAYPRRSWYALFGHAPGIRPETGNPLMYGGYGYYRAQDYLLEFDPAGDTWRELPVRFGTKTPGPRNSAWLLTGWDERRILLLGGSVAQPGQAPPVYTYPLDDAWSYDPADSTWTEIPVDPGLVCSLKQWLFTKVSVATDPDSGSILFPIQCPTSLIGDRAVVQWRPLAGSVDVLGTLPRDLALQKVLVGSYLVPGSDSVTVMFWRAERASLPAEWMVSRFRFRMRTDYAPDPTTDRERRVPWLPWLPVVAAAAAVAVMAGIRRRRRTADVTTGHGEIGPIVVADPGNGTVRLLAHGVEHRPELAHHARELLAFVARRGLEAGQVLEAEEINDIFLTRNRDVDTARVTKNRALDQLNGTFTATFGRPLLERRRSPVDRRRVEYVVGFTLRRSEDQPG